MAAIRSVLCASVALGVLVLASCVSTASISAPIYGVSGNAVLAVKDYEPQGIIIVKSEEKVSSVGGMTGSKITYEMLMNEAKKLNADDVINVRIDVKRVSNGNETVFVYTATALAIKYTTAKDVAGQQYLQGMGTALPEEGAKGKSNAGLWLGLGSGLLALILLIALIGD